MTMADIADAVKRSVTARQAAEMLGLNPNPAGFCRCPIHGEKTGSMKLYPGQRGWYCFGCHTGGSVIDLVMACCGLEMIAAVSMLNDEFNLGLPIGHEATREQEEVARKRQAEREAKRKRREAARAEQEKMYDRYCDVGYLIGQYELDAEEYAPKPGEDAFSEKFAKAMMELPVLKDEAERLAVELFKKEEQ